MKLDGIQFLKNIPAWGRLFLLGETDIPAIGNQLFLHFSETPVSGPFRESFIPASGNEFFVCWKEYYFLPSLFLLVEAIIEIRRKSPFKEKPNSACGHQLFKSNFSVQWKHIFQNHLSD